MNQVGAVLLTAALAAIVAIVGIISQRAIARRQATFNHIAHLESDRDIIDARIMFVQLAKNPGGLAIWADADNEKTAEAMAIGRVLNSYELIAIGIQRGVIDYELFKRWHQTSAISFWQHGLPFVARIRERINNDMLFHEFEQMVAWFRGESKPRRRRMFF